MVKAQYRRVFQSTTTGASACPSRLTFRRKNPGCVPMTSNTKPSALRLIMRTATGPAEVMGKGSSEQRADRYGCAVDQIKAHHAAADVSWRTQLQQRLVLGLIGGHKNATDESARQRQPNPMRQAEEEYSDTENHSPDDRRQCVSVPARNGSHDQRAQQRANAKGTQ
jgi:hypothetical protein